MVPATAIVAIGLFVLALWLFGVVRVGVGAIATARGAVGAMRDPSLDDDTRERAVQRASLRLFGSFASILFRSALTLLASFVPIWFVDAAGLTRADAVVEFLSRWDVIIVATVVMVAGYVGARKLWRTS